MLSFKVLLIVGMSFLATSAFAGTIYLMGIGLGTPGASPPPVCSNSLDFTDSCNSQYITVI